MVRKFGKFLKKSKDIKFSKSSKKVDNNNNNFSYTCFECGKQGHIKFECPIYLRKHGGKKKGKKERKQKKAYMAWVRYIMANSSDSIVSSTMESDK